MSSYISFAEQIYIKHSQHKRFGLGDFIKYTTSAKLEP